MSSPAPVSVRACQLKKDLGMVQLNEHDVLLDDRPPWRETNNDETMMEEPLKSVTDLAVQNLFRKKSEKFGTCIKITHMNHG